MSGAEALSRRPPAGPPCARRASTSGSVVEAPRESSLVTGKKSPDGVVFCVAVVAAAAVADVGAACTEEIGRAHV